MKSNKKTIAYKIIISIIKNGCHKIVYIYLISTMPYNILHKLEAAGISCHIHRNNCNFLKKIVFILSHFYNIANYTIK